MSVDIASLPLVLAGPIVRRVTNVEVNIWLALRDARDVTLQLFDASTSTQIGTATAASQRVGDHLHVALVTLSNISLTWGTLYTYDLYFMPTGASSSPMDPPGGSSLFSVGVLTRFSDPGDAHAAAAAALTYTQAIPLPSFALSPNDVRRLRVVHGSCRDPDYDGDDALLALDVMIADTVSQPLNRPHLLALTGDQIYADEHSEQLLAACSEIGEALLGWPEVLPQVDVIGSELPPGEREGIADIFELDERPRCLRLSLAEFCASYLLWWSPVLWPDITRWNQKTIDFVTDLAGVRRALANVPTYMIFDDHEVKNNWNLNHEWCRRMYRQPLGRRAVTNALLSFALFQGWGNAPQEQGWRSFDVILGVLRSVAIGRVILAEHEKVLSWALSVPDPSSLDSPPINDLGLWHGESPPDEVAPVPGEPPLLPLSFHFSASGPGYQLLGLDERTWRKFSPAEEDRLAAGELLSELALAAQLPSTDEPPPEVTFVMSSSATIQAPMPWIARIGQWCENVYEWWKSYQGTGPSRSWDWVVAYSPEVGDIWYLESVPLERFLAAMVGRAASPTHDGKVIVLAGDLHYSYAARLAYSASRLIGRSEPATHRAVIAHFVSSGCRRESENSNRQHRWGYNFPEIYDSIPDPKTWFGWSEAVAHDIDSTQIDNVDYWRTHPGGPRRVQTGSPLTLRTEAELGNLIGLGPPPDWRYRIDYMIAEAFEEPPPLHSDPDHLANWSAIASAYQSHQDSFGNGKEIVGKNNLGEIVLDGPEPGVVSTATQNLWWRMAAGALPEPWSQFVVDFDVDDDEYPIADWERPA
ncbi:MAG: hypothetical protein JNK64_02985 [Myxococcales bacterium]|nr:hypothetical protein [Myxococcales bacterium]